MARAKNTNAGRSDIIRISDRASWGGVNVFPIRVIDYKWSRTGYILERSRGGYYLVEWHNYRLEYKSPSELIEQYDQKPRYVLKCA